MDEVVMTAREVAEFLKVNYQQVYRLADRGILKKHNVGGSVRFFKSEVIQAMRES